MSTGERIREFRKELGLSLQIVAERAGMKAPNLSDIENGKRDIRMDTLNRIAQALGCDPSTLIDFYIEEDIPPGLADLISDLKTRQLMSISEEEIEWMRSIRFRPNQTPSKKDFIDLLFTYRNIE